MKKNIFLLILSFTIFNFSIAQQKAKANKSLNKSLPENVNVTILSSNLTNDLDWQKNMPWIGAIIVGGLTVLTNILINKRSLKTSREVINLQLENAKDIALAQLNNSKQIVQTDFNKTVLSGNRQAWINDLRDCISKIISKLSTCSLRKTITRDEAEEIYYLITKVELMLNPEKDTEFIKNLNDLHLAMYEITLARKDYSALKAFEDKVKDSTQKTLKTEWERVKKGE
jgi:hypothetical protein